MVDLRQWGPEGSTVVLVLISRINRKILYGKNDDAEFSAGAFRALKKVKSSDNDSLP